MDFKCPYCGYHAFGNVSDVAGAQFATCHRCGKTVRRTADVPKVKRMDSEAERHEPLLSASKSTMARRPAEDKFTKTRKKLDDDVKLYQQEQRDAETAKIARLRALRLARDASLPEVTKPEMRPVTRKARVGNGEAGRKETRSRYLGGYE